MPVDLFLLLRAVFIRPLLVLCSLSFRPKSLLYACLTIFALAKAFVFQPVFKLAKACKPYSHHFTNGAKPRIEPGQVDVLQTDSFRLLDFALAGTASRCGLCGAVFTFF
jgi:hypothetical protein